MCCSCELIQETSSLKSKSATRSNSIWRTLVEHGRSRTSVLNSGPQATFGPHCQCIWLPGNTRVDPASIIRPILQIPEYSVVGILVN